MHYIFGYELLYMQDNHHLHHLPPIFVLRSEYGNRQRLHLLEQVKTTTLVPLLTA